MFSITQITQKSRYLVGAFALIGLASTASSQTAYLNSKKAKATMKKVNEFAEQCGRFDEVKTNGYYVVNSKSNLSLSKLVRSQMHDQVGMKYASKVNLIAVDQAIPEAPFQGKFLLNENCTDLHSDLENLGKVASLQYTKGNTTYTEVTILKRFGGKRYVYSVSGKYAKTPKSKFNWDVSYADFTELKEDQAVTDKQLVDILSSKRHRVIKAIDQKRLSNARNAIIDLDSSAYGEAIYEGRYQSNDETFWRLSTVRAENGTEYRVVYFDEFDDGSYSVYFHPESANVLFVVYEN